MSGLFKGISRYMDSHFGNQSKEEKTNINFRAEETSKCEHIEKEKNFSEINENGHGIRVKHGIIEVKGSGIIIPCKGIELYINENICKCMISYEVDEKDKIEYKIIHNDKDTDKEVYVEVSEDKMKGFVSVQYIGSGEKIIKDAPWSEKLLLKCGTATESDVEKYNISDIKNILRMDNIVKGIDEDKLREVCEKGTQGQFVEVACGVEPIDDIPSTVKILFDIGDKELKIDNTIQKIDYKNVYSIVNVEEGDILAEIIPRVDGVNGFNVLGEEIQRKIESNKPIKIGNGCIIENNKIIATKNGRPSSKNSVITVNAVYKINNVDITSGNIKFIGDVEIDEGVSEGMTVSAGNSILINKNVDSAKVSAGGEINIKGNIINSKITTGQIDIEKKLYIDELSKLCSDLKSIIQCSDEISEKSNKSMNYGEIIKILIESKFGNFESTCTNVIKKAVGLEIENHEVILFIKNRILGLKISNLNNKYELLDFEEMLKSEIDFYEDDMIIQSNINICYCQDSMIKSTGKIVVTGTGTYVSDIIALNEVEFTCKDAVARGGKISSLKSVSLGTVGSPAGVRTIVEVPEDGVITAKIAYVNTQLCFGKKSKVIDSDCKNLKAYVNEFGEIEIEKLNL